VPDPRTSPALPHAEPSPDVPAPAPPAPEPPRDTGTRTAAGLAAAQLAANGVAVIFTAIFARVLGRADYGVLAAALSTFLILSVPGYALQLAASRAVAAGRLGTRGELGPTVRRWGMQLAAATFVLAIAAFALRGPLADLLNVRAEGAAAATLPTVTLWVLLCLERGVLAGRGAYGAVGWSIVGEAAGRLVLGLALVGVGLGTTGAYLGTPLAMALAAVVLARVIAARTRGDVAGAPPAGLKGLFREALVPTLALALVAVLQNVDVIVVRHQVGDVEAGAYAAAAVAAKVVVWTAVGVALYVIPEAAGRTAAGRAARSVLLRAAAVVAVVAAPALLVMGVAPALVLRLGFGPEYEIAADALPLLGVAMTLLALTYLTVNYLLARGATRFLVPLAVVALAEPVLLAAGSLDRLTSFATVVLLVQLAAAAAVVLPTLRRAPAREPARA
jgi:O-antigen/teichoic acid export membrane protein